MSNLLYIFAFVLILIWAIGYFGFHASNLIHPLLALAIISVLIKLIQSDEKKVNNH